MATTTWFGNRTKRNAFLEGMSSVVDIWAPEEEEKESNIKKRVFKKIARNHNLAYITIDDDISLNDLKKILTNAKDVKVQVLKTRKNGKTIKRYRIVNPKSNFVVKIDPSEESPSKRVTITYKG